MKNEIKEILDYFRYIVNDRKEMYTIVSKDTIYLEQLLDYITNLQEEVNKLTAESTEWESKCYNLQEENNKLKNLEYKFFDCSGDEESFTLEDYLQLGNKLYDLQEENERLKKLKERYQLEKEDYKIRNEKAIEYIKKSIDNSQPFYEYLFGDENGKVENLDKLLNILQGKSDE